MTLKEMLRLKAAQETADKWYRRWKNFNTMPYKDETRKNKIYQEWQIAEQTLDDLLYTIKQKQT